MSAGFAAADVAVSGSARMGVVSTDGASTFSSRVRMTLTGSGTTDGGLAFGGSFGVHDTAGANAGTAGSTFISGAFGKISMGGLDSGDAVAVGHLASVGYTGLGSFNSMNYAADGFDGFGLVSSIAGDNVTDAGGAKVLYTYAANGLSLNVSTAQLSNTAADHTAYGVGAAYTTGALTVAVGYGDTDITLGNVATFMADTDGSATTATVPGAVALGSFAGSVTDTSVSATYVMGATTIKAIYQDKALDVTRAATSASTTAGAVLESSHTLSATSMGMSVAHSMDALTLTAFGVTTDISTTLASSDAAVTRYGVGAAYDLGGGASLKAGWVSVDTPAIAAADLNSGSTAVVRGAASTSNYNAFDVGVNFSF